MGLGWTSTILSEQSAIAVKEEKWKE